MLIKPSKKLIYLDHAATTPVRPEVLRAMAPFWSVEYGNPSALYKLGVHARQALEKARSGVASVLSCRPQEVIFTAGGSESINLALLGVARYYRKTHPLSFSPPDTGGARGGTKHNGHIITSAIEHHAVMHAANALEQEGFAVTRIGVNREGVFNINELKNAIRPDTFLVSLMYANNEIGTIEPIAEIGNIIKNINAKRMTLSPKPLALSPIFFHTDACQAAGYLDLNVDKLHVDLLTLNGSKIYGPKQTGCLFARKGTPLEPIIYGGGQELTLRSGTENVPGIVGFAKALPLAQAERARETKRLIVLRDYFIAQILKHIPKARLNGPIESRAKQYPSSVSVRLPNNIHVSFADVDGEALMLYLDAHNIAVATGSACTSESTKPSHVLKAIGLSSKESFGSIRFTLGKQTTKAELNYVLKVLPLLVAQQRKMMGLH